MDRLPPETELERERLESWAEMRAWYAWQERVEFVQANGERRRDVIGYFAVHHDGRNGVAGLLPPARST